VTDCASAEGRITHAYFVVEHPEPRSTAAREIGAKLD
jgi:hypothetical protein